METIHKAAERVHEAVMGAEEPVSAEGAPAIVCIKTFMPNPGKEKELEEVLHEHYKNLQAAGLVRAHKAVWPARCLLGQSARSRVRYLTLII